MTALSPHPWYGPCDAFGVDGACAECTGQHAQPPSEQSVADLAADIASSPHAVPLSLQGILALRAERDRLVAQLAHLTEQAGPDSCADVLQRANAERDRLRAALIEACEAVESLRLTLATSARDWSVAKDHAWIYGVLLGWGDANDEIATKHGWSDDSLDRMAKLRYALARLARGEE